MGAFRLCVVTYIYNRLVNACILKIFDWIDMFMLYVGKGFNVFGFLRFSSTFSIAHVATTHSTQCVGRRALKTYTAVLF